MHIDITDQTLPIGFVAVGLLVFPYFPSAVRAHCRSVDVVQQQTRQFAIQHCSSACCEKGHDDGNTVCDRDIILRCVSAWFGSAEEFEQYVQTKVQAAMTYQLGNEIFSFTRIVCAAGPWFWIFLDWGLSRDSQNDRLAGVFSGLAFWLAVLPCA